MNHPNQVEGQIEAAIAFRNKPGALKHLKALTEEFARPDEPLQPVGFLAYFGLVAAEILSMHVGPNDGISIEDFTRGFIRTLIHNHLTGMERVLRNLEDGDPDNPIQLDKATVDDCMMIMLKAMNEIVPDDHDPDYPLTH